MASLRRRNIETLRDDRIAIQTALRFKIPYKEIEAILGVTPRQIVYAKTHPKKQKLVDSTP